MEKVKNRDEYLKSFPSFGENVKVDENFKRKLREHQYFNYKLEFITKTLINRIHCNL